MSLNRKDDKFYFDLAEQAVANIHANWEEHEMDEFTTRDAVFYAVSEVYNMPKTAEEREVFEYTLDQVQFILNKR